jgi:hypothetical protein
MRGTMIKEELRRKIMDKFGSFAKPIKRRRCSHEKLKLFTYGGTQYFIQGTAAPLDFSEGNCVIWTPTGWQTSKNVKIKSITVWQDGNSNEVESDGTDLLKDNKFVAHTSFTVEITVYSR